MRRAFTLIEINMAMLIMAGGILSVVGLYAFGFRENRQSREDVAATAVADAVVSQLMMAITATNITWDTFKKGYMYPPPEGEREGWGVYTDSNTGVVTKDPETMAERVFDDVMTKLGASGDVTKFPQTLVDASGMKCGLVVMHDEDSPIVRIAFRATKQPGTLLSMPLFYTEARFQGVLTDNAGNNAGGGGKK